MRITIEIDGSTATMQQSQNGGAGVANAPSESTQQMIARAISAGSQNGGPAPTAPPSQMQQSAPMPFTGQGVAAQEQFSGGISAGAAPNGSVS